MISASNFFCWRSNYKNSCFGFHQVSKHSKTIKPLGLRPRGFKCFSRVWKPDETLALVFEIVLLTGFKDSRTCSYTVAYIHLWSHCQVWDLDCNNTKTYLSIVSLYGKVEMYSLSITNPYGHLWWIWLVRLLVQDKACFDFTVLAWLVADE